jgi:uncharacterized membrane protein YGL010W
VSYFIEQGPLALLTGFFIGHALGDFPLQGDYLAKHKVRSQAGSIGVWIIALSAHSLIHAGAVWLVSGSLFFCMAELLLHALIDFCKGEGRFGIVTDQVLHLACKVVYVPLLVMGWPAS